MKTRDNAEAVAYGLSRTGGIITGAALIMVAVFAAFASGRLVMLQMGFGLAVAVLIDATIIRSALVPAVMRLLGDRNWFLPRWLGWLPEVPFESRQTREAPLPLGDAALPTGRGPRIPEPVGGRSASTVRGVRP